jgi:hypothetical protein
MGSTSVTLTCVTLIRALAVGSNARGYHALMLKVSVIFLLAIAIVLAFNGGPIGTDRTYLFGVCIAFMLVYGVRAIISWRERREERRMREAHERLMRRVRGSRDQIDFPD